MQGFRPVFVMPHSDRENALLSTHIMSCQPSAVRERGAVQSKCRHSAHCAASVCKLKLELNGHVWGNHLGCRDDSQENGPLTEAVSVSMMYAFARADNANASFNLYSFIVLCASLLLLSSVQIRPHPCSRLVSGERRTRAISLFVWLRSSP